MDLKRVVLNYQFRQYRQYREIDGPIALRGLEVHKILKVEGGPQSKPLLWRNDTWRLEENCGPKHSLVSNLLWPRPQLCVCVRSSPKVTSEEGPREKGLTPTPRLR